MNPPNGLYPLQYNVKSGGTTNRLITFGAAGDSFYEYLLKAWIQVSTREAGGDGDGGVVIVIVIVAVVVMMTLL